jgi:hypothetical protein
MMLIVALFSWTLMYREYRRSSKGKVRFRSLFLSAHLWAVGITIATVLAYWLILRLFANDLALPEPFKTGTYIFAVAPLEIMVLALVFACWKAATCNRSKQ